MQQPKVSIVVPCWGVEKYLDKCVESIVNQTLHEIEIILVDDVSPDRVPEMCDAWAQKDSRIKVIHKTTNEGLGMACNTGIDAATGEYIAFCDSDDWVDAVMYETMYRTAVKIGADAVITGIKRVNTEGAIIGELNHPKKEKVCCSKEQIAELLCDMIASSPKTKEERHIQASAKVILYRKQHIQDQQIYFYSEREIPSEDLFFNINFLASCNCVCVLPQKFYNYRITIGSITQEIDRDFFEKRLIVLHKKLIQVCNRHQLGFEAELRAMRMLIGYVRVFSRRICNSKWNRKTQKHLIHSMMSNEIWNDVWKKYPISSMPYTHKIYLLALKYKLFRITHLLSKLKSE